MKGAEADGGNSIENRQSQFLNIELVIHTKVLVGIREINQSSAVSRSSLPPEQVSIPILDKKPKINRYVVDGEMSQISMGAQPSLKAVTIAMGSQKQATRVTRLAFVLNSQST